MRDSSNFEYGFNGDVQVYLWWACPGFTNAFLLSGRVLSCPACCAKEMFVFGDNLKAGNVPLF